MNLLLVLFSIISFNTFADTLPIYPNDKLTPGAVDPTVTEDSIINHTFSTKTVRLVPSFVIIDVYKKYGIVKNTGTCGKTSEHCEVDHRVSCENGGICGLLKDANGKAINDPKRVALLESNLWPQIYEGKVDDPNRLKICGAHAKDKLENKLASLVRSRTITLKQDQEVLMGDWVAGYKKYVDPKGCDK